MQIRLLKTVRHRKCQIPPMPYHSEAITFLFCVMYFTFISLFCFTNFFDLNQRVPKITSIIKYTFILILFFVLFCWVSQGLKLPSQKMLLTPPGHFLFLVDSVLASTISNKILAISKDWHSVWFHSLGLLVQLHRKLYLSSRGFILLVASLASAVASCECILGHTQTKKRKRKTLNSSFHINLWVR